LRALNLWPIHIWYSNSCLDSCLPYTL
jgi:hypothetical protein